MRKYLFAKNSEDRNELTARVNTGQQGSSKNELISDHPGSILGAQKSRF